MPRVAAVPHHVPTTLPRPPRHLDLVVAAIDGTALLPLPHLHLFQPTQTPIPVVPEIQLLQPGEEALGQPAQLEDLVAGEVDALELPHRPMQFLPETSHREDEVVAEVQLLQGREVSESDAFDGVDAVVV